MAGRRLWILTGPIPLHEGVGCESVAHVVQTRPATGRICSSQTNLPRQSIESSMNVSAIQTIAPAGNEQIGGHCTSGPMAPAPGDVVCKHLTGRCVQRHESSLAELGAADRQHCCLKIDILKFEIACLAQAQPETLSKSEQTIVNPRSQFPSSQR